eukprot:gnl/Chilomastix_caulleri/806.p1 GENE.gnl/Chilomastix_caulleri/806~~gnl/Chilomastix_caulleri/806.p1  ORF type:complete len:195 (+),score=27.70 gnl/Chilomastix_caulleri/806:41-625(+)
MLVLVALIALSLATNGLDVSHYEGNISVSQFSCLYDSGYVFLIIQAQNSNGSISNSALTQYNNAVAAGYKNIDFYIFPDVDKDPVEQVRNTINFLKSNNLQKGNMLWIDVENTDLFFSSCSSNITFLHTVFDTANSMWTGCGLKYCVGMYTSESQWSPIACGDTSFSKYQLWWPRYDNSASSKELEPIRWMVNL